MRSHALLHWRRGEIVPHYCFCSTSGSLMLVPRRQGFFFRVVPLLWVILEVYIDRATCLRYSIFICRVVLRRGVARVHNAPQCGVV
jgi:hypothetical protein